MFNVYRKKKFLCRDEVQFEVVKIHSKISMPRFGILEQLWLGRRDLHNVTSPTKYLRLQFLEYSILEYQTSFTDSLFKRCYLIVYKIVQLL